MYQRKGFTLIEIVVVIVIIGILAAIALPRMFDFTGKAEEVVQEAVVGSLNNASNLYQSQWLLRDQPQMMPFGGETLVASAEGFPLSVNGESNPVTGCQRLANAMMKEGSARFGTVANVMADEDVDYIAIPVRSITTGMLETPIQGYPNLSVVLVATTETSGGGSSGTTESTPSLPDILRFTEYTTGGGTREGLRYTLPSGDMFTLYRVPGDEFNEYQDADGQRYRFERDLEDVESLSPITYTRLPEGGVTYTIGKPVASQDATDDHRVLHRTADGQELLAIASYGPSGMSDTSGVYSVASDGSLSRLDDRADDGTQLGLVGGQIVYEVGGEARILSSARVNPAVMASPTVLESIRSEGEGPDFSGIEGPLIMTGADGMLGIHHGGTTYSLVSRGRNDMLMRDDSGQLYSVVETPSSGLQLVPVSRASDGLLRPTGSPTVELELATESASMTFALMLPPPQSGMLLGSTDDADVIYRDFSGQTHEVTIDGDVYSIQGLDGQSIELISEDSLPHYRMASYSRVGQETYLESMGRRFLVDDSVSPPQYIESVSGHRYRYHPGDASMISVDDPLVSIDGISMPSSTTVYVEDGVMYHDVGGRRFQYESPDSYIDTQTGVIYMYDSTDGAMVNVTDPNDLIYVDTDDFTRPQEITVDGVPMIMVHEYVDGRSEFRYLEILKNPDGSVTYFDIDTNERFTPNEYGVLIGDSGTSYSSLLERKTLPVIEEVAGGLRVHTDEEGNSWLIDPFTGARHIMTGREVIFDDGRVYDVDTGDLKLPTIDLPVDDTTDPGTTDPETTTPVIENPLQDLLGGAFTYDPTTGEYVYSGSDPRLIRGSPSYDPSLDPNSGSFDPARYRDLFGGDGAPGPGPGPGPGPIRSPTPTPAPSTTPPGPHCEFLPVTPDLRDHVQSGGTVDSYSAVRSVVYDARSGQFRIRH